MPKFLQFCLNEDLTEEQRTLFEVQLEVFPFDEDVPVECVDGYFYCSAETDFDIVCNAFMLGQIQQKLEKHGFDPIEDYRIVELDALPEMTPYQIEKCEDFAREYNDEAGAILAAIEARINRVGSR